MTKSITFRLKDCTEIELTFNDYGVLRSIAITKLYSTEIGINLEAEESSNEVINSLINSLLDWVEDVVKDNTKEIEYYAVITRRTVEVIK